jgi:hypothetical protein
VGRISARGLGAIVLAIMDDIDDVEIELDIVPLDCPPEEYFGYNYDYGRVKLLNAIDYLSHRSQQSTEIHAIEILKTLSLPRSHTRF